MDDNGDFATSAFDSHPPNPPVEIKSSRWKPALMLLIVLLASLALLFSTLAVVEAREEEKRRIEELSISQCEALNQSRKNIYDSNMALATMTILNAREPLTTLPPIVEQFVRFTAQAYDPISCDINDSNFGKDSSPPDTLPPNPLIEELIKQ